MIGTDGKELGNKLIDALGLPKNTVWLELRVAINEVASVTCCYYPDISSERLIEVLSEYELHAKSTPCVKCGAKGLRTTDGMCYLCFAAKD
jgi:hypothetical protein